MCLTTHGVAGLGCHVAISVAEASDLSPQQTRGYVAAKDSRLRRLESMVHLLYSSEWDV